MANEIERKYLISTNTGIPSNQVFEKQYEIEQHYISLHPIERRIRRKTNLADGTTSYYLTEKSNIEGSIGTALQRNEMEIAITQKEYEDFLKNNPGKPIKKVRRVIADNGVLIEIDFFINIDLILAEVEFDSIIKADEFVKPSWLGEEVTHNPNFKNINLWLDLQ